MTSLSQEKKGKSITAFDFFKENNPSGYFTKPDFLKLTESLERKEPIHFVKVFESLNKGERIEFDDTIQEDKWGREYLWIKFTYARAVRGLKLVGGKEMVSFISDYAYGKINVDFTVDELTDEAFND